MKIRSDLFRVRSHPYDDAGQRIEPEQQPMQRILHTDAPVSMQGSNGGPVGSVPTDVIYESTVGQMAGAMRNPCWSCKHFDKKAWAHLYRRWNDPTTPIDERNQLNAVRAGFMTVRNEDFVNRHASQHMAEEGDLDVEHVLSQLGVCRPISEIRRTPVIVHPIGGCPADFCGPTQPNGFYQTKDRDHEKVTSQSFDNLMGLAVGKRL